MTDEEKKEPEGGNWPGILALKLLSLIIILSILGIYLAGNWPVRGKMQKQP